MKTLNELEVVDSITVCVFNINGTLYEVLQEEVEAFGVEEVIKRLHHTNQIALDDAWDYERDSE